MHPSLSFVLNRRNARQRCPVGIIAEWADESLCLASETSWTCLRVGGGQLSRHCENLTKGIIAKFLIRFFIENLY
jgi:hypothetical protein